MDGSSVEPDGDVVRNSVRDSLAPMYLLMRRNNAYKAVVKVVGTKCSITFVSDDESIELDGEDIVLFGWNYGVRKLSKGESNLWGVYMWAGAEWVFSDNVSMDKASEMIAGAREVFYADRCLRAKN